jgi:hypothetical protein
VAAGLGSVGVFAGTVAAGSPVARAARDCRPPDYPGSGYFTSLTVRHVRCSTGRKLALAYYQCRIENGGRDGRCTRRVMRYRCTEERNRIATEIDARVRCRRGIKRIIHTYQQNL